MSNFHFLKNFVKTPTSVGAVWPSSPILAKAITSHIDLEKSKTIVELGPRTGVFTKVILDKIRPDAKLIIVELNEDLYKIMRKKFPHDNVKIYNETAANLGVLLDREDLEHADTIISGLPWVLFPVDLQEEILEAIHNSLPDGGTFSTFSYIQGRFMPKGVNFKKLVKKYFSKVETTKVVWRNVPPAFIYRCTK